MSEDNSEHEIEGSPSPKRKQVLDDCESNSKSTIDVEAMPSLDEVFAEGESYEHNQYLKSICDEMPDLRIPVFNQKANFIFKKKLLEEMQAIAEVASTQAVREFMHKHPLTDGLAYKYSGRVYARKYEKVSYGDTFIHMLDCMLDRRAGFTTQKAILESVVKSTGIQELNTKVWKMQLKRFMKKKLAERLQHHGVNLSIASCSNMSDIRKAIDTYFAKRTAVHTAKLAITITSNEVIVNNTSHKISLVKSSAYEYKRIRLLVNGKRTSLNVNVLMVLFGLAA